jgi:hypothetical protein
MQQLGLDPVVDSVTGIIDSTLDSVSKRGLYLHDIENAIANLAASTFWMGKRDTFISNSRLIFW